MSKIMFEMFVNLFRFVMNNNFFGFVNVAPVGEKSEGAIFFESVIFVSDKDFTAEGTPQATFINRLEKVTAFFRRFSGFFENKGLSAKFSLIFIFDNNLKFYDETGYKFATFMNNYFDSANFENFEVSAVTFEEFFGNGKSFDFETCVKFAAVDINNEFPFNKFDLSNGFSFFFVDARQQNFAFPFDFGFNNFPLKAV